jgi:hypothetical protein
VITPSDPTDTHPAIESNPANIANLIVPGFIALSFVVTSLKI